MQVNNNYTLNNNCRINIPQNNNLRLIYNKDSVCFQKTAGTPSFHGNPLTAIKDYIHYKKLRFYLKSVSEQLKDKPEYQFRNLSMEYIEGIQRGIKVFKGLSMKDIQYLSENLHVIAVKRGCTNMCGYCYADAKPSNREMSWEDFTSITGGFKELKKRLCDLPIFGENMHHDKSNTIYKTTELFYDADCIGLAIKDKKGKVHDFRDLVTELYDGLGRRSAFDTSGWAPQNKLLQQRAEDYAEYFSKQENMNKLEEFNLSFNVFNASNVAAERAMRAGDREKAYRLREKYTDKIANAIFTFTPLLKNEKFNILTRSFGLQAKNAEGFDVPTMITYIKRVQEKVKALYEADLNGGQKYIKTPEDLDKNLQLLSKKLERIETGLNSSGRMLEFMKSFGIKAPMQNHTESTKIMYQDLKENGRYHRFIAHKLIDTDGRVYHMDYARFFPTEIQLNLENKTPTPKLANLRENCLITSEIINAPEKIWLR